jgi:predicted O-linked N-acetylglucosamine transferase (SPINDLY family)
MTPDPLVSAPSARTGAADSALALGLAHAAAGRWAKAAAAYADSLAEHPADALLWVNLAHACLKLGAYAQGAKAAAQACALAPARQADTLALQIAVQCLARTDCPEALAALFDPLDPATIRDAGLWVAYGMALARLGRQNEALTAFFSALRRDPACAEAFTQLGSLFQLARLPEEACEAYRNAMALGGPAVGLASAVVFTSFEAARWDRLEADLEALDSLVDAGAGYPMPFYALTFPWPRERQLAGAQAFAQQAFGHIRPLPAAPDRRRGRPPRIAYVSGDLHAHATAYLVAELFEHHDPHRVLAYAYSTGDDDGSAMRQRLVAAFDGRFCDARGLSSAALAQRVREDGIDVLIDLKGYTLYSRNEVFAWRAAPLQVNFLGFPGTLGTRLFDYIIGDPVVTPLAHADGYAEKIAQMPVCYQPNDRQRPIGEAAPRSRWGLPQEAFVFCCFNANYKITPEVFDRWCAILRAVPHGVMWLLETNDQSRRNLVREAGARGVPADRIFWSPGLSLPEHLGRIQCADLFLDTGPVNAHTTASDALWAGLPVLTCPGETFASRVASSLLCACGLDELVCSDAQAYQDLAVALAHDHGRMSALRALARAAASSSALFDSARYCRDFEGLLLNMVERHERGLPPDHLPASAVFAKGFR